MASAFSGKNLLRSSGNVYSRAKNKTAAVRYIASYVKLFFEF